MSRTSVRYGFLFVLLSALTVAMLFLSIFIGSSNLSFGAIFSAIFSPADGGSASEILWKIRIPRALASLLLGGALALSGYLLQTFFHNPIAGPFVLGVSSGAKLVVALAMIATYHWVHAAGSLFLIVASFVGSMLSLGFVLLVSRTVQRMSLLVVCGVMISYICSAITDFVVTFADDANIVNLHDWSMGTFSGMTMENVGVIAIVVTLSVAGTIFLSKPMGAYLLGENYAQNMGVNIRFLRAAMILLSGLLSACVTAFAGPISFVGIAVPHILRLLFRTARPLVMIPACFLGGSIFCMVCDMIARTVFAPTELSISTVTAIFGAPVVIAILIHRKRGEL